MKSISHAVQRALPQYKTDGGPVPTTITGSKRQFSAIFGTLLCFTTPLSASPFSNEVNGTNNE